jgi:flagella basal body P-ring formation protein FlgA
MKSLIAFIAIALAWATAVRAETTIGPEEIQRAVESFVMAQVKAEVPEDTRVVIDVRWQRELQLSGQGTAQIRVRRTSSRPLRGPSVMRVGIDVDGQTQHTMSVTADVRIWRPVVVASHMLQRGEVIGAASCEVAERDVTQVRGQYYADALALQGMRARRTVGIGDIVTDNHVEKMPVVRRGDAIVLVARVGSMSMSASGEALQDGGIGDRIRVKNSDSGKTVYGHVLEGGAIRVGL